MTSVLPGIFAISEEKSVAVLADRVACHGDAVSLQVRLDDVGETLRVGLLVVDDEDAGGLDLQADVVRHRRALDAVVRHRPEEESAAG